MSRYLTWLDYRNCTNNVDDLSLRLYGLDFPVVNFKCNWNAYLKLLLAKYS
jgi:hypothetical protein